LILNTVAGNGFIILGFYLNWCGARSLHRDNVEWIHVSYLLGGSVFVMLATFHLWYGGNPVYTLAQSLPLALTAIYLIQPSRGIASSDGTQISPETLLDSADRALYETKRRGRDGYSVFGSPVDHTNNIVRLDHFPASGSAVRS
jgi:predicted signal transduction protein with EAL and GGDEF domain